MAKRRTSGIQRRSRVSEEAKSRRLQPAGRSAVLDPRLLLIGGLLVVGVIVLVVVLLFGGGGGQSIGERQPDQGGGHVADGQVVTGYNSRPATSGQHWGTPAQWGVYSTVPAVETQVVHNLEHGGIVIWYTDAASEADVSALTDYVANQVRSSRYKVILSPWSGEDFGHPIAVTSWNWLLYQDAADIDQVRAFLDEHYGDSPEPFGGPGQPPG